MASTSGGDSNEEIPWQTIMKGNRSIIGRSQLERSGTVTASDSSSSNRSDMRAVSNNDRDKRSGKYTASTNDSRGGG